MTERIQSQVLENSQEIADETHPSGDASKHWDYETFKHWFVEICEKNPILTTLFQPVLKNHFQKMDRIADEGIYEFLKARDFLPDTVLIQLSRHCNLRCTMCPWETWETPTGFMDLDIYRDILADLKANGVTNINFNNPQGEPLLNPKTTDYVRMAINEGFNTLVGTNVTTLGNRNANELLKLAKTGKLNLHCSFSGYDKESHEAVYQGSNFENTVKKLNYTANLFADNGLAEKIEVLGVVHDTAPEIVEKHVAFITSQGIRKDRLRLILPDNFAGNVKTGRLYDGTVHSNRKFLAYRSLRLCNLMAMYVLIYTDGTVSACSCRDPNGVFTIGDLKTQSLREIRNGKKFHDLMDAFMKRDISAYPVCQKCDLPYGDQVQNPVYPKESG